MLDITVYGGFLVHGNIWIQAPCTIYDRQLPILGKKMVLSLKKSLHMEFVCLTVSTWYPLFSITLTLSWLIDSHNIFTAAPVLMRGSRCGTREKDSDTCFILLCGFHDFGGELVSLCSMSCAVFVAQECVSTFCAVLFC
jgi:hypothetical protein